MSARRQRHTDRMQRARINAGMDLRDLAESTGIATSQLARYEAGRVPRPPQQLRIATALGGQPMDYWPFEDDEDPGPAPDRRLKVAGTA